MILINNDHLPEPLGHYMDPVLCAQCSKYVYRIDNFGWVHLPYDHTQGDFNDAGEWCEYSEDN